MVLQLRVKFLELSNQMLFQALSLQCVQGKELTTQTGQVRMEQAGQVFLQLGLRPQEPGQLSRIQLPRKAQVPALGVAVFQARLQARPGHPAGQALGPLDQDPNGEPIRSLYFVQVFLFLFIQVFLFLFSPGFVAQTTSVGIHPKQCSHAKVVLASKQYWHAKVALASKVVLAPKWC